jgi:hypothetical protein
MKSAKNIKKLIKRVSYKPCAEMHSRTLNDALDALEAQAKSRKVEQALAHSNKWRIIMKSQIARYSTAAIILVTVSLILLNPFGALNSDGIALADVQENLGKIETVVIRGPQVFTSIEDPNESYQLDTTTYMSTKYGYAEEAYEDGQLIYYWSANIPKKLVTIVIPYWKKYLRFPLTEDQFKMLDRLSINGSLSFFLEGGYIGGYEELGPDNINGIEVEGFEIRDLKFLESIPKILVNVQSFQCRMWVGTEDLLPVKTEADAVLGKCLLTEFTDMRVHESNTFESYDVELDEALFDPNIPADHTPLDLGLFSSP